MALQFAYSLDGSAVSSIRDLPLDTATNYKNGVGTNGVKRGDLVFIDATSGLVKRTINAASPKAHGVVEGVEFQGLMEIGGQTPSKASFTALQTNTTLYPNGVVKVRMYNESVYKIAAKAGQTLTNANIGKAYGISQDAAGDQTLDTTQTTNTCLKVHGFTPDGKFGYVTVASNPTV